MRVHVGLCEISSKILHGRVVLGLSRECDGGMALDLGAKVRRVGDVEEGFAFLLEVSLTFVSSTDSDNLPFSEPTSQRL